MSKVSQTLMINHIPSPLDRNIKLNIPGDKLCDEIEFESEGNVTLFKRYRYFHSL